MASVSAPNSQQVIESNQSVWGRHFGATEQQRMQKDDSIAFRTVSLELVSIVVLGFTLIGITVAGILLGS